MLNTTYSHSISILKSYENMPLLTLKNAIENAESDEDFEYLTEEEKNCISIITSVSCGIGFTSLCFVGRCQFDGNQHDDKDMVYERMIGLRKMYPYNGIQYSCDKQWMFECVCLYKYLELGTFPNSFDFKYHNLPRILKVRRSNGSCQDSVTTCPSYGIQVRKPTSRSENNTGKINIYITVVFDNDMKTITDEDIMNDEENGYTYSSFKDLTLEQVVDANPILRSEELKLRYYAIPISDGMCETQQNVIKYFNNIQKNWCENYLAPALKRYTDDGIMRCSYEIC